MTLIAVIVLLGLFYTGFEKFKDSLDSTDKALLIGLVAVVVLGILLRRVTRYFRARAAAREKARRREMAELERKRQNEQEEKQKRIDEKILQYMLPTVEGAVKKYVYEKIPVTVRDGCRPQEYFGRHVTFRLRENERTASLRILSGEDWIGTVDSGTIVSVAAEWLRTGEPYRACVMSADDETRVLSIGAIFYRDELGKLQKRFPDAPRYKIMGTRSEDAYLIAHDTQIGEALTVDLDPKKNRYALYNYPGEIVGYLSTSAAKYAEEHDIDRIKAYCCDKQLINGAYELFVQLFY